MKLSILNYGLGAKVEVPAHAKREDEALIASASSIARERGFGKGGIVVSEVMHTDLVNLNYRCYRTKGLEESIQSFYTPIYTPFLMHHDSGGMGGGASTVVAVGANLNAQFVRKKVDLPNGQASGYVKVATFVGKNAMVGEMNALEALQNRQLMGLSIGSRVQDDNYQCSICNESLYSDECNHHIGQKYDGKLCYANVFSPFFREYSAVYSPADINALIRRVDIEEGEGGTMEEHLVDQSLGSPSMALYETVGTIYPSAAAAGVQAGDGQEDEMNIQDLASLISGYEQRIAGMKTEYEGTIAGLRKDLETKDQVIATLAKRLGETDEELPEGSEEGDMNTDEPTASGKGTAPSDNGSDAEAHSQPEGESEGDHAATHSVTDGEAPVEGAEGNPEGAAVEGTDGQSTEDTTEPVQPSDGEGQSSEATDATAPTPDRTGEHQSYRTLLRSRDAQFGILSVSSNGSRGKIPSRFRI